LRQALGDRSSVRRARSWAAFDPEFSKKLGARGWIGLTWPKRYGGQERSFLERYVLLEELLAAGAPPGRTGSPSARADRCCCASAPRPSASASCRPSCAARATFAIGMSEPDSGSDLASIRTRAVRTDGGYVVNGTKVWTSNAHRSQHAIALLRTAVVPDKKHEGLSQFLVDLKTPGITIRPIINLAGSHDFNEVVFQDAFVPDDMRVGGEGDGWKTGDDGAGLRAQRPERYLSSIALVLELIRAAGSSPDPRAAEVVAGWWLSSPRCGRCRCRSPPCCSRREPQPRGRGGEGRGTTFEQSIRRSSTRSSTSSRRSTRHRPAADARLPRAARASFSLRGGTREVLRGIIARVLVSDDTAGPWPE